MLGDAEGKVEGCLLGLVLGLLIGLIEGSDLGKALWDDDGCFLGEMWSRCRAA